MVLIMVVFLSLGEGLCGPRDLSVPLGFGVFDPLWIGLNPITVGVVDVAEISCHPKADLGVDSCLTMGGEGSFWLLFSCREGFIYALTFSRFLLPCGFSFLLNSPIVTLRTCFVVPFFLSIFRFLDQDVFFLIL